MKIQHYLFDFNNRYNNLRAASSPGTPQIYAAARGEPRDALFVPIFSGIGSDTATFRDIHFKPGKLVLVNSSIAECWAP